MTTHSIVDRVAQGSVGYAKPSLLETIVQGTIAAYGTLAAWNHRQAQRQHLLELDERLLRDAGLSREDAEAEAAKPFWRS